MKKVVEWHGEWPPKDVRIRVLSDIIDASPNSEWLTSAERAREAERLINELDRRGFRIVLGRTEPK